MIKDYYYLLGLPRGAPLEEIKSAYRRLAAQYHPDKVAHLSPDEQQAATATMRDLNEAIAVLSDPRRRAGYDETIRYIPERKPRRPARKAASRPPPMASSAPENGPLAAAQAPSSPLPTPEPTAEPLRSPEPPSPTEPVARREEQSLKWQQRLEQLPLKWTRVELRNWDWAVEASNLRCKVVVAHRHWETLSLLSVRTLLAALARLVELHKWSWRSTTLVALISFDRLMDAQGVQEQLQNFVEAERGWFKKVRPVLILYDRQTGRREMRGLAGEEPSVQQVVHLLASGRL